jgi:hypothetical protein
MTGVIVGQLTPEKRETNTFLGPPNTSNAIKGLYYDDNLDIELMGKLSQDESDYVVLFINDSTLGGSPQMELKVSEEFRISAILDSGSEINLIAEDVYQRIAKAGIQIPVLPVENVVLVTAFGKKSKRIKQQVLVEFTMGSDLFESVFMVCSQLRNEAIIGCQFLIEYGISVNFNKNVINYIRSGSIREQAFLTEVRSHSERKSSSKQIREVIPQHPPPTGRQPPRSTADCEGQTLTGTVHSRPIPNRYTEEAARQSERMCMESGHFNSFEFPCGICNDLEGSSSLQHGARCDHFESVVELPDTEVSDDLFVQSRVSVNRNAANEIKLNVMNVRRELPVAEPVPTPKPRLNDPRSLQRADAASLVDKVACLSELQQMKLYQILIKYLDHMTTKPGRCILLEYRFQVDTDQPIVGHSRPIPFALRPAVRAQITQLLEDDILEISASPVLNPLTIIKKEGGNIRICVDARKVNQFTVPDRERVPPIQELLQKCNGARYFTSLDLSSAFLQIQLHEDSRRYTAFLFDSTVYQFKRIPYGFKNSLSAFIRAIKLALGGSDLEYVVFYVDDILIYSRTFDEHMMHIDAVLGKLTTAGFTINANKCRFCKEEVRFLGHRIDRTGVSADPDRIAAILNYPAPRNSKQLRQFLGTCNFHSRFIPGYANYVAPLTPLLKQGVQWLWAEEAQDAFRKLRESFAHSIHLVHPREGQPYAIYTDASKLGISSILSQKGESGETLIVSTASRVLSPVERRYSTCEQELLAVVYALQKFRIYVIGHTVTVYSDNKALSFLKRCNLTSSRVTR